MKTLAVCYSKTGTTKKAADAVVKKLGCDLELLRYDEKAHTIEAPRSPAGYDRVIILCPIWAFSLAEPMKLYLNEHKADVKKYSLVVTCGRFGLRGCVSFCKKAIGRPPEHALKLLEKDVKRGDINISAIEG